MKIMKRSNPFPCLFLLILLFWFWGFPSYAKEEGQGCDQGDIESESEAEQAQKYVDKWLESIDMDGINDGLEELFPEFDIDRQKR